MQDDEKEKIKFFQDQTPDTHGLLSIGKIAKIFNVCPQTVHYHIFTRRINVYKFGNKKLVDPIEYSKMRKWDRSFTTKNGSLIYDKNKGTFSLSALSKLLNVKYNCLYYLIKKKSLNFSKIDGCIVINKEDILNCDSIKKFVKDLLGVFANECINSDIERFGSQSDKEVSVI